MALPKEVPKEAPKEVELELDARQRLPLARVVQDDERRFSVRKLPDGSYVLTPIVSISARELALLRNPAALASLRTGIEEAARGDVVRHPSGYYQSIAASFGPEGSLEEGDVDEPVGTSVGDRRGAGHRHP